MGVASSRAGVRGDASGEVIVYAARSGRSSSSGGEDGGLVAIVLISKADGNVGRMDEVRPETALYPASIASLFLS